MIKVSDYIAKRLKEHYQISDVFLITGGGAMHLNDSFGKKMSYITAHNEQALSMMAEGYARLDHRLAVVNVTTGPGGLNCLNGVFGQWTDSVPVLYISGQVKFSTTMAFCPDIPLRQLGDQEVNIIHVVKPLTKYAVMVTDPLTIKYHLDRAVYEALNGRMGPVWLDIPLDVQSAMVDEFQLKEFVPPEVCVYDYQMAKVVQKLKEAKRPLIIAGQGIRLSRQKNAFKKLLEKLKIPFVATFCGMDQISYDHPNFAGRIGILGQRSGNFALQNADCVLCLGSRNSIFQISYNYENFAKNAYKIIVDIDPAELEKPTLIPDLKIHADLKNFIPLLHNQVQDIERHEWVSWCVSCREYFSFSRTSEYQQTSNNINPYYFVHSLVKALPDDSIMVTANGTACNVTYQVAENKKDQRIFWNKGNASMGYGLPAAMGACIASGRQEVVCLEGDGSIMMNIQELQTIKHYNLPIKIFILNNKGYLSIKQTQTNLFDHHFVGCGADSCVTMPDFVSVARAFGLDGVTISAPDNLETQIQQVLSMNGSVVCNVLLEEDYFFSPKLSARRLEDGTIVSPPLEDMSPFLDREHYHKFIIKES